MKTVKCPWDLCKHWKADHCENPDEIRLEGQKIKITGVGDVDIIVEEFIICKSYEEAKTDDH